MYDGRYELLEEKVSPTQRPPRTTYGTAQRQRPAKPEIRHARSRKAIHELSGVQ
jgi:hypothetical protein